jgi:hypothetical protein
MSLCKYCNAEIVWKKDGLRNVPTNIDGTTHDCRKKEAAPAPVKHMGFHEAEEAMAKKEAQVKPAEPCTSPTVTDATSEPENPDEIPGEVLSVTIGSTISLGNHSNVHLEIVATDAETARYNFRKEIHETTKMVRSILKEVGGA